ncbi:MAG TPA: 50S ribosomal protein L17, partial [Longimicrobiales bacterium]|nr:50S ribosomal protein L17 [Longimicrobiales bacterium]
RPAAHRKMLLRNLATSLFLHGRIETTVAKAKEVRIFAEPLITKAKRGDLHARRQVARRIHDGVALAKLFEEIAPRYSQRPGGYTRLRHVGHRPGDAADIAILELVE